MRRREFITLVGGAAAAWCSVARAQTRRRRPVIATFGTGTPTQRKGLPFWPSFLNGLRELGYIEGSDFDIVARLAATNDELPKVAEELIQLNPDVILASASVNALAAKRATSTIPIVVAALGNPAALGLSESDFRRPSGNLTGIMPMCGSYLQSIFPARGPPDLLALRLRFTWQRSPVLPQSPEVDPA
jgi:putative tryptophan/tyrosine transport system substrate-binding protein